MKPLAIEFQAFGSYPGKVSIDFTVLARRGLFVVAGDTGAGKSTIFDAMCFALYGEMPLKEGKDVRSHHAPADAHTYVRFTFETEGERYVVERTPEYLRAAKRGSGSTSERATATVARIVADRTEPIATKPSDALKACIELVGLKAEQFQRVILLPQGEFAEFLLAGSKDREELLGQLFGGKVFDDIVDELKQREQAMRRQVGDVNTAIEHQLLNARGHAARLCEQLGTATPERLDGLERFDRDAVEALLDQEQVPLAAFECEVAAARDRSVVTAELLTKTADGADRFDRAGEHRRRLEQLVATELRILADEVAAKASSAARPVVVAADALDLAHGRLAVAQRRRDERCARIVAGFDRLGIVLEPTSAGVVGKALAAEHAALDTSMAALRTVAAAGETASEARRTLDRHRCRHDEATQERATVTARLGAIAALLPAVVERTAGLDLLPAQIEQAKGATADRRTIDGLLVTFVDASERVASVAAAAKFALDRFVATQAPRLAAALVDGEPCAVCGSIEHPHKALAVDGAPTTFDGVQAAGAARDEAIEESKRIEAELQIVRGRLGDDADRSLDELDARVDALTQRLTAAERAHREQTALEAEQQTLHDRERRLDTLLAELGATITANEADVARCEAALVAAAEAVLGIDVAEVERRSGLLAELDDDCDGLDALFDDVSDARGAVTARTTALDEVLATSPFATVDEARTVLLDRAVEETELTAAERHRTEVAKHRTVLETLEQQGLPAERPDVDEAQRLAAEAATERDRLADALTTAANAVRDARTALTEHDRLVAESGELREQHRLAAKAYKVCNEGGTLNMPLRRWVLANELDRVTNAANVHLQRMTASRYTLRRRQEVVDQRKAFGLDLEVLDAHTGRTRATSSLSGGEQFQASLSLALGLADVVSHGGAASGKRFEALFVDEGFGSLDPAALQEAIGALHHLHATGRMVGAITHVEAMKQDLHVGIEVTRLPDGRGSTLVVHP